MAASSAGRSLQPGPRTPYCDSAHGLGADAYKPRFYPLARPRPDGRRLHGRVAFPGRRRLPFRVWPG